MATKLQDESATDTQQDVLHTSPKVVVIGDPAGASDEATYKVLTGSYQDPEDLDAEKDAVLDLYNFGTIFLEVDYVKGAGDDARIKVLFGSEDDADKCNSQESLEDNESEGEVKHENIEHVFESSFRGLVEITRISRYCKVMVKSGGSPNSTDKIAVAVFGQNR